MQREPSTDPRAVSAPAAPPDLRGRAVGDYLGGGGSLREVAGRHRVGVSTLVGWLEADGREGAA